MFVIVQSPQGLQNVQTNNSPLLNLNWKRLTTPHQAVFTQTWTQEQFEKKNPPPTTATVGAGFH